MSNPYAELGRKLADANSDAKLLFLCAVFHDHHSDALADGPDDIHLAAMKKRCAVTAAIKEITPVSVEGWRAKAEIGVLLLEENDGDAPGSADTAFALATLRDLAAQCGEELA